MNLFGTTGQQRRNWLDGRAGEFGELLRYYLGPTGIPDRLMAAGNALAYTDAGDMVEAADASRAIWSDPSIANAGRYATAGAALAIPFVGAKMMNGGVDVVGDALRSGVDDVTEFVRRQDGTFAGVRAKTADLNALARAEDLTARGASRDDIWRDTGWFQGVDGKWRFEIDDAGSRMKPEASRMAGDGIPLDDAFGHLDLKRAYPEMFDPAGVAYRYDVQEGTPTGSYSAQDNYMRVQAPQEADMSAARSATLHELQHAIQKNEGFARGGSPGSVGANALGYTPDVDVLKQADTIRFLAKEYYNGDVSKFLEVWSTMPDGSEIHDAAKNFAANPEELARRWTVYNVNTDPVLSYQHLAGETEARNAQTRRDFTPDQRRATPPWVTQDVPDEQQIVRMGGR